MDPHTSRVLVEDYYQAFNDADFNGMLELLSDEVIHDINQGKREIGKEAFAAFLDKMNAAYKESLQDIFIMVSEDGTRAAAEFTVHGTYLQTEPGLPPAKGQHYQLSAGAFFEIQTNRIARITNYYNLEDWIRQVSDR